MWTYYLISRPHGQPHAVVGELISISVVLCKEFIGAENTPHIIMQRTTFLCSLGILAVVNVCRGTAQAKARVHLNLS